MKDWRGTEIEVGDTIVYAVKHSTVVEINEAVVTSLGMTTTDNSWQSPKPCVKADWKQSSRYGDDRINKQVSLASPENITVLRKAGKPQSITVSVIPDEATRRVINALKEYQRLEKKSATTTGQTNQPDGRRPGEDPAERQVQG